MSEKIAIILWAIICLCAYTYLFISIRKINKHKKNGNKKSGDIRNGDGRWLSSYHLYE